jgi:hypothetical protein
MKYLSVAYDEIGDEDDYKWKERTVTKYLFNKYSVSGFNLTYNLDDTFTAKFFYRVPLHQVGTIYYSTDSGKDVKSYYYEEFSRKITVDVIKCRELHENFRFNLETRNIIKNIDPEIIHKNLLKCKGRLYTVADIRRFARTDRTDVLKSSCNLDALANDMISSHNFGKLIRIKVCKQIGNFYVTKTFADLQEEMEETIINLYGDLRSYYGENSDEDDDF